MNKFSVMYQNLAVFIGGSVLDVTHINLESKSDSCHPDNGNQCVS